MDRGEIRQNFHAHDFDSVFNSLETSENGLSFSESKKRTEKYGFNEIEKGDRGKYLLKFIRQFNSFLVFILVAAAVISFFFGSMFDVYVITGVIIVNALIGFVQEFKAEKAMDSLRKMIVSNSKVFRDGELVKVPSRELVPGDILYLESGDRVPADARLFEVKGFRTVESALTGESLPIEKSVDAVSKNSAVGDRKNMVFLGTYVSSGTAKAIVVGTGKDTEFGNVAESVKNVKEEKGHFEQKTDYLGKQLGTIAILGSLTIFFIGFFFRDFSFVEIFLFSIAELVSAIPEGLPAVLSVVLAIGAFRMSQKNAIIRKLSATETLSVVDTIITDKTGTLTENTMTVRKVFLASGKEIDVSGIGWNPGGRFLDSGKNFPIMENRSAKKLLFVAGRCNASRLVKEDDAYGIIGDPTEGALVVLAEKAGLSRARLSKTDEIIDEFPFNQDLKYRACLVKRKDEFESQVVGAPESVLERCSSFLDKGVKKKMTDKKRDEFKKKVEDLGSQAFRVLALGYRSESSGKKKIEGEKLSGLVFIGLVGMIDPPREGVKESISKARTAGIRVIMATGDHKRTAEAIAKEIGLLEGGKVYSSRELERMSQREFDKAVKEASVFARLTPDLKLKIAQSLQKQGSVIAMTGDGVNDAPALKQADIGISMGKIGTDVARHSSDIVLADDNFSSIVDAVEQGRIVFMNTKQTSSFLVTMNFAEQATLLSTLLLGLPLPLLPTQILFINLVTETGPALGLAAEPGDKGVLRQKPRSAKQNLLSTDVLPFLAISTGTMLVLTLSVFLFFLEGGIEKARTGVFATIALTQLYNALNLRSMHKSLFKLGLFTNRSVLLAIGISILIMLSAFYFDPLRILLGFEALSFLEVVSIFVISSAVLWAGELYKFIRFRKS